MRHTNAVAETGMKILDVTTRHFCDCELAAAVAFRLGLQLKLCSKRVLQLLLDRFGLMGDVTANSGCCRLHLFCRKLAHSDQLVAASSDKSTQRVS